MVERVVATSAALALIARLREKHGPLVFLQSGGCCEGSAASCFPRDELQVGPRDLLLGEIGGCPFYCTESQYEYLKHTQLVIDALDMPGGGSFSLEGPEGKSFHTGSRLFSDAEWAELQQAGLV